MGGAVDLVSSALGFAQDTERNMAAQESAATIQLREEREAQEAEQLEQEADERRKKRQQLNEAREVQRRRLAKKNDGQTTLMRGGLGVVDDPEVHAQQLKNKFGE